MKIYLDIDGVILDSNYGEPLPYVREFLEYVYEISNGNVYWLSTLKEMSLSHVIDCLQPIMDDELLSLLKKINPSPWNDYKTEGIDLSEEFLWFDDNIFEFEYRELEKVGKEYCLIKVENNLEEIVESLKEEI